MTPEERAREIVYSYELDVLRLRQSKIDWLAEQIANTIRAAVEEERERCNRIETAARGLLAAIGNAESMKGPPSVVLALGVLVAVLEGVTLSDDEIIAEMIGGSENTNAPAAPER